MNLRGLELRRHSAAHYIGKFLEKEKSVLINSE